MQREEGTCKHSHMHEWVYVALHGVPYMLYKIGYMVMQSCMRCKTRCEEVFHTFHVQATCSDVIKGSMSLSTPIQTVYVHKCCAQKDSTQ